MGPSSQIARLKIRPGQGKASGRLEVELGNIDCRTWSKVGKEIDHTRTMDTVNTATCRAE